jgi:hypothetical protein
MLVEDKAGTEEAIEIMTEVDGEAEVDKRKVFKYYTTYIFRYTGW